MTANDLYEHLIALPEPERIKRLRRLTRAQAELLRYKWDLWGRAEQRPPPGEWTTWLIMAGRGFGKTRAGAEWVRAVARDPDARIALVGASLGEARAVMVEGDSGVLSVCPPGQIPAYEPSLRRLLWPNGAQATLYSAAEPEGLRGPQHSHAWCDEIAKWDNAGDRALRTWDNLLLGLRLGEHPRVLATTTPRAVPLLRRVRADAGTVCVTGASEANLDHLPSRFLAGIRQTYGGTALGRQELDGELLDDIDGALWSRALLEQCRLAPPTLQGRGPGGGGSDEDLYRRVVVAVDPPASATGDACGIVVAALLEDGTALVLADASVEQASPERWARAVALAAHQWQADRVVAEANQGGAMVASVLRAADVSLPLKLVHASKGKVARAEPVAALYEAGRVRHAGVFARLEDELCGLMAGGAYQGPGRSPDRADALVWALTELMLGQRARPRIWCG